MSRVRFSRKLILGSLLLLFAAIIMAVWTLSSGRVAETVTAQRHVAVTANPHASEAARTILRAGGSAVDASIAAQLVLTLVEPQSSGIGGGLFMLVSDPKAGMRVFDGRETAPGSVSPGMFQGSDGLVRPFDEVAIGGQPVGVPGAIAALALAHQRYGRLPWADLFEPAIRLADEGFIVSPLLAIAIAELDHATLSQGMRAAYLKPDGSPPSAGERLRDTELARTLRLIAEEGPAGFYQGEVAQAIVSAVRASSRNPGRMTLADLAGYRAREIAPICLPYRVFRVCTTPAPSGGVTLLQVLGLLEGQSADQLRDGKLSQIHLLSQAERLAYADRARWMADPEFVTVPEIGLLDRSYLKSRGGLIEPGRDMGVVPAGTPPVRRTELPDYAPHRTPVFHGTSHLSIVDGTGQVVSMTMSIQAAFGAQLRAAGFVLNNELTDFSFEPEIGGRPVANAVAPGKRPLSAMSPSIVFDAQGRFHSAIGSPGGPEIISYNAQALVNLLDSGERISKVVSTSHFANLNAPTILEGGSWPTLYAPLLFWKGHQVRWRKLESGLNGIARTPHGYEAASDIRGDGAAVGD